jgi:leucyl-tRNA synthetase
MKIENQHDREKLTEAKKIIYKAGFYSGIMNENTGEYAGMKVEEAKDKVKEMLIKTGEADLMYELSGKTV